jgi:L-lactate utilization protein LutC
MIRTKSNESVDTTEKEIIRRNVRHALSDKMQNKFPNLDVVTNLFEDGDGLSKTFVKNFRNAGGKFIPCTSEQLIPKLMNLIESQQYKKIMAIDDSLIQFLRSHGKQVKKDLVNGEPAHAAIFHTDALIAREGSICFTQKNILHTSIYNLAQDVIVVAHEDHIKLNFKETMDHLVNVHGTQPPLIEIITPSPHTEVNGKEVITPANPRFILFLVVKNEA